MATGIRAGDLAKRPALRRWLTVAAFLATLLMVWLVSMVLHEVWHGVAAQALGGNVVWMRIRPGIEVYPAFGQISREPWGTGFMAVGFTAGAEWTENGWQRGVVGVMGSLGNLLLASMALSCLWLFHPRGWLRLLLMAQALMFIDLLLYCTLPEFFGLPHYIILGGDFAEPLHAAMKVGCPRWAVLILTGLASALMAWAVVAYARSSRAGSRAGG